MSGLLQLYHVAMKVSVLRAQVQKLVDWHVTLELSRHSCTSLLMLENSPQFCDSPGGIAKCVGSRGRCAVLAHYTRALHDVRV